jgi:tRNA pseudouridine38-40 synthase
LSTKRRIKFTVAYDGTDFCGFAPQAGQRTVHSTLTEGLYRAIGEEVEVRGASRTDSGAHALGQVGHFDCTVPVPIERWPYLMNKVLPRDLSVCKAEQVSPDFDARFMARKRHYRYRIITGERNPMAMRWAHYYGRPLNLVEMREAANKLVGEHSFLGFSQEFDENANPIRTLFEVRLNEYRDQVVLDVVGTAFVRGMMRRIAGSLLEIGRGKQPQSWMDHLLSVQSKSEVDWPPVLPACGLTLIKVFYGRHPSDHRFDHSEESE